MLVIYGNENDTMLCYVFFFVGCGGTGNIMCSECGGRGHVGLK
jgi:hypothetical protein